jgi:hypothetical protein
MGKPIVIDEDCGEQGKAHGATKAEQAGFLKLFKWEPPLNRPSERYGSKFIGVSAIRACHDAK